MGPHPILDAELNEKGSHHVAPLVRDGLQFVAHVAIQCVEDNQLLFEHPSRIQSSVYASVSASVSVSESA